MIPGHPVSLPHPMCVNAKLEGRVFRVDHCVVELDFIMCSKE